MEKKQTMLLLSYLQKMHSAENNGSTFVMDFSSVSRSFPLQG